MEENNNKDLNRQSKSIDYASLVSSAVGAVAGVVGANSVQSAIAANVVNPEPEPEPAPVPPRPNPAPAPEPKPEPEPIVTVEENVTVVYKETVDMGGGQMADIAIGVTPEGNEVAFIDADQDGVIDFKMEDINHDGEISENEVIDVQAQNIHMDDLMHQAEEIAQLPDYNPNANVDEFLA